MNSGAEAFQYDPFGRRVQKTSMLSTTNYLYDGFNPVQELSGTTPTANLLEGLNIDEYLQRTNSSGPVDFLTDALRSTLALTDSNGNTVAQYTYEPLGNTTGGGSGNPYQLNLSTLRSVIRGLRAEQKSILATMEKLERDRQNVEAGLLALRDGNVRTPDKVRKRKRMSKAARQRISQAQKKRRAAAKKVVN
jgi:hypothetical protein